MPGMDIRKITARWINRYNDETPKKAGEESAARGRASDKAGAEIMRQVSEAAEIIRWYDFLEFRCHLGNIG